MLLLAWNASTIILLVIYFARRANINNNNELKKMTIKDLK